MTEYYPTCRLYQALREQLAGILGDEDLTYTRGGEIPPLGALCREIGETEQNCIRSFRTWEHPYEYGGADPAPGGSVAARTSWYAELDRELEEVVAGPAEEDLASHVVDRGGGFILPPRIHLSVYNEALLIFYGKASVYRKAMGREPPEQWRDWIG